MDFYQLVVFVNVFIFMGAYAGANNRFTESEDIQADTSGSLRAIKTIAVIIFIPSFIINTFIYMIPSLVINFFVLPNISLVLVASIPSIIYIVGLVLLKNRILSAWNDRRPLYQLFDKIEKGADWVSLVFIFVLWASTFIKLIFDSILY